MVLACVASRSPFDAPLARLVVGSLAGLLAYGLVTLPGTPAGRMLRDYIEKRRGAAGPPTAQAGQTSGAGRP